MCRALAVFLSFAAAVSAAAATRLIPVADLALGSDEVKPWSADARRPSMASDGDETLVAFASAMLNGLGGLYAIRLDRNGRPLSHAPMVLIVGTAEEPVNMYENVHVVWLDGLYAIFFTSRSRLHAIRVTREGDIVSRHFLPFVQSNSGEYEVATRGYDLLIADQTRLVHLRADLSLIAVVEERLATRVIVAHDDRYAVVSSFYGGEGILQHFDGKALSKPYRVAGASNLDDPLGGVAWTGSEYVVTWTDCTVFTHECDIWMERFTGDGAVAGEARKLDGFSAWYDLGSRVGVTSIGDGAVFVTWEDTEHQSRSFGRRYRASEPLDSQRIELDAREIASFSTANGLLLTVDDVLRVAAIESPAAASLGEPWPATPALFVRPAESLLTATASATEVAIARRIGRLESIVSIHDHAGRLLREVPFEHQVASMIATDAGFVTASYGDDGVWLRLLEPNAAPVKVARSGYPVALAYADSHLILLWVTHEGVFVRRFAPNLVPLGRAPVRIATSATSRKAGLCVSGREVIAAWSRDFENVDSVRMTASNLRLLSGIETIDAEGADGMSLTSGSGRCVAFLSSPRSSGLRLALYEQSGWRSVRVAIPFAIARSTAGEVAAVGDHLVAAFMHHDNERIRTDAALLDDDGNLVDLALLDPSGSGWDRATTAVLPLAEDRVMILHNPVRWDPPHYGMFRVHAKIFRIGELTRRRSASD